MSISIVIPTYLQRGHGPIYLAKLLDSIKLQRMKEHFEVCISDNDLTKGIVNVIGAFLLKHSSVAKRGFQLAYKTNIQQGASENLNSAIEMATYDKVKIMCMDDLFLQENALQQFSDALDKHGWVISGSRTMHESGSFKRLVKAYYDPWQFDHNYTGMPSVVGFLKCTARFNPELKTFTDLDFYRQLYDIYGMPGFIQSPIVAQRYHRASQSSNQPKTHAADAAILKQKYGTHEAYSLK